MTVTCRGCGRTVPEDDAYPVLASGVPAWVCSPDCGADVAEATARYAARLVEREVR